LDLGCFLDVSKRLLLVLGASTLVAVAGILLGHAKLLVPWGIGCPMVAMF